MTNKELINALANFNYDQKVNCIRQCVQGLLRLVDNQPNISDGKNFVLSYMGAIMNRDMDVDYNNFLYLRDGNIVRDALGSSFDPSDCIDTYLSSKYRSSTQGEGFRRYTSGISGEFKNYMLNLAFVMFLATKFACYNEEIKFVGYAFYDY